MEMKWGTASCRCCRSLQGGGGPHRNVWPEAAGPAASRRYPDPTAAWGSGSLWWQQHWTQCAQLLPTGKITKTFMWKKPSLWSLKIHVYMV